jgi:hypothetical protein
LQSLRETVYKMPRKNAPGKRRVNTRPNQNGVRGAGSMLKISIGKALKTLRASRREARSKKKRYGALEADGFWARPARKANKTRLIGMLSPPRIRRYSRACMGKRDIKTAAAAGATHNRATGGGTVF